MELAAGSNAIPSIVDGKSFLSYILPSLVDSAPNPRTAFLMEYVFKSMVFVVVAFFGRVSAARDRISATQIIKMLADISLLELTLMTTANVGTTTEKRKKCVADRCQLDQTLRIPNPKIAKNRQTAHLVGIVTSWTAHFQTIGACFEPSILRLGRILPSLSTCGQSTFWHSTRHVLVVLSTYPIMTLLCVLGMILCGNGTSQIQPGPGCSTMSFTTTQWTLTKWSIPTTC